MKKFKLLTVVGTRPEIIRLSEVIKKIEKTRSFKHILVHTGQNYDYELNEIFFNDFKIREPDYFLNAALGSATKTAGQILINIDPILEKEKPDAFLVLGDTNSCLCAIAAKKRKIPIFHMEAGNRCFDQRVPEETNRKIIDHISDVNLTYSQVAKQNLLAEGLPIDRIFCLGSPMQEILETNRKNIENSTILKKLSLKNKSFFVVSAHREENIETDNFYRFLSILNSLSKNYKIPVIVSTHPRTRERITKESIILEKEVTLLKPLGYFDYIKLQQNAFLTLSDSGTISEESSILDFPALNIRETHERQEAMEEASVMMVGMNLEMILQALTILKDQKRGEERTLMTVADYSKTNVSEKVVRIILSYTDYIKRVVWGK